LTGLAGAFAGADAGFAAGFEVAIMYTSYPIPYTLFLCIYA
jgi:hypothetical protein